MKFLNMNFNRLSDLFKTKMGQIVAIFLLFGSIYVIDSYLTSRKNQLRETFGYQQVIANFNVIQSNIAQAKIIAIPGQNDFVIVSRDHNNNVYIHQNDKPMVKVTSANVESKLHWVTGQAIVNNKNVELLLVGRNSSNNVFMTPNALADDVRWTQLKGTLDKVDMGNDGSLYGIKRTGTKTGTLMKYIPGRVADNKTWSEGNWIEIDTSNVVNGLVDIDVKNDSEIWGTNAGYNVYKYYSSGGVKNWYPVNDSGKKRISVGVDGTVWGIGSLADQRNKLFMRNSSGSWEPVSENENYLDIDVHNKNTVIAISTRNELSLGEIEGFPEIPTPVPTPFKIYASSGGYNGYNERQDTDKPQVELHVNYKTLFGVFAKDGQPEATQNEGFNLVALDEYGRLLGSPSSFDLATEGDSEEISLAMLNKINQLMEDKEYIMMSNQVGPYSGPKDGSFFQNKAKLTYNVWEYENKLLNHIRYKTHRQSGGFPSIAYYPIVRPDERDNVESMSQKNSIKGGKTYKLAFSWKSNGNSKLTVLYSNRQSFSGDGAVISPLKEINLAPKPIFARQEVEIPVPKSGFARIYINNLDISKLTEIKDISFSEVSTDTADVAMLLILLQKNGYRARTTGNANTPNTELVQKMSQLGFKKFKDIRINDSYIGVMSVPRRRVLSELLRTDGEVVFVSEGKPPVIDAAYSRSLPGGQHSQDKYFLHNKESVKYNMELAESGISEKLTDENNPNRGHLYGDDIKDKNNTAPADLLNIKEIGGVFKDRIDGSVERPDAETRQVFFLRGNFWLLWDVERNQKVNISGQSNPNVIGKGLMPLPVFGSPKDSGEAAFLRNGVDAGCIINGLKDQVLFRGNKWVVVGEDFSTVKRDSDGNLLKGLLGEGLFGDLSSDVNFSKKIDAAVNSGVSPNQFYLFSGDKWVLYDYNSRRMVNKPESLVFHPKFNKLPITFRVGDSPGRPLAYMYHTQFKNNVLLPYDITAENTDERPGWDMKNWTKTHSDVRYNYYRPPLIAFKYRDMNETLRLDDTFRGNSNETINKLLTHYQNLGSSVNNKYHIKRYGGNTVSFFLKNKKGKWRSHDNVLAMLPGNFYKISIWARTTEGMYGKGSFNIRPILGKGEYTFDWKRVKMQQGWQKLVWYQQISATGGTVRKIEFEYEQESSDNSMHTLFGPIVKALIKYPSEEYLQSLIGKFVPKNQPQNVIVYLQNVEDATQFMQFSKNPAYTKNNEIGVGTSCSITSCESASGDCSTVGIAPKTQIVFYQYQCTGESCDKTMCLDPKDPNYDPYCIPEPDKFIMSSGFHPQCERISGDTGEGSWNVVIKENTVDGNTTYPVMLSDKKPGHPDDDVNNPYLYVLMNERGKLMFLHIKTNRFIGLSNKKLIGIDFEEVKAKTGKNSPSEMYNCLWSVLSKDEFEKQTEGFANYGKNRIENFQNVPSDIPPRVYIESSAAYIPKKSDKVILFNKDIFCIYDIRLKLMEVNPVPKISSTMFQRLPEPFDKEIDATLSANRNLSIVYMFSGDKWILWDLEKGNYTDYATKNDMYVGVDRVNKLGPGGHPLWSKLPTPFSKVITCAFTVVLNGREIAILISGQNWVAWDLVDHSLVSDIKTLNDGWAKYLPRKFRAQLDSGLEFPKRNKMIYFFSGPKWILFNFISLEKGEVVEGPYIIGPSHERFAFIPPPFRPSKAEKCKLYQETIKYNTNIPDKKCVPDPKRTYTWIDNCPMLDEKEDSCAKVGGIYNKEKGYCGTKTSEGRNKFKKTNPDKLKDQQTKYWKQCKTIPEWDHIQMNAKETDKNDRKRGEYETELEGKNWAINTTKEREDQYDDLTGNASREKAVLKKLEEEACKPVSVCTKNVRGPSATTSIPKGCNPKRIEEILRAGGKLSESDLNYFVNQILKENVINEYPITRHPDYTKYVSNDYVHKCKDIEAKKISDFKFGEFPDSKDYINIGDLNPLKDYSMTERSRKGKLVRAKPVYDMGSQEVAKSKAPLDKATRTLLDRIKDGDITLDDVVKSLNYDKYMTLITEYLMKRDNEGFQDLGASNSIIKFIALLRRYSGKRQLLNCLVDTIRENKPQYYHLSDIQNFNEFYNVIRGTLRGCGATPSDIKKAGDIVDKMARDGRKNNLEGSGLGGSGEMGSGGIGPGGMRAGLGTRRNLDGTCPDLSNIHNQYKEKLKRKSVECKNNVSSLKEKVGELETVKRDLSRVPQRQCNISQDDIRGHPDFTKLVNKEVKNKNNIPCWKCNL